MVQEITPSMETMILQTNAGNKPASHNVKVPNYGEFRIDVEGMANILSLAKMKDKYNITYDCPVEIAFNMHTANDIIKFHRTAQRKLYYKPKYNTSIIMVQMVKDNKNFFTDCQVS